MAPLSLMLTDPSLRGKCQDARGITIAGFAKLVKACSAESVVARMLKEAFSLLAFHFDLKGDDDVKVEVVSHSSRLGEYVTRAKAHGLHGLRLRTIRGT